MEKRIEFFGIYLDLLTFKETIEQICEAIEQKKIIRHTAVNVAKLIHAQKNEHLRNIINSSQIINVDGAGIIIGAKTLGISIPQRVTGIDMMQRLIEISDKKGYKVFFFGASEDVLQKMKNIYLEKYSNLQIVGMQNGYYDKNEEIEVVEKIRDSKADILFVAMGTPQKEEFLYKYANELNIPFSMGVGGSFDVIAGKTKRAPIIWQKIGMEWLYRLIQEPKKMWKRYLTTNALFGIKLLLELFNIYILRKKYGTK